MGLETATSISALNALWPLGTDPRSQGDDHLRLIKSVMKSDVPSKAAPENVMAGTLRANQFAVERNGAPGAVNFRVGGPAQTGMYAYNAQNVVYFAIDGTEAALIEGAAVPPSFANTLITRDKGDARYVGAVRLSGGFTFASPTKGTWTNAPDGGVFTSLYFNNDGYCTGARGIKLQVNKGGAWVDITGGF